MKYAPFDALCRSNAPYGVRQAAALNLNIYPGCTYHEF